MSRYCFPVTIVWPIPAENRDIQYIYEKRLPRLRDWSTGTVSVVNGNNTATFSSTADIQNRLVVGSELVVGTATAAPTADPTETYPVIKSIDSATQVTLQAPYLDSNASDVKYIVSPVSEVPEHHHSALVSFAAVLGFKKGTNPSSDSVREWQDVYNAQLISLISDVELRQGS